MDMLNNQRVNVGFLPPEEGIERPEDDAKRGEVPKRHAAQGGVGVAKVTKLCCQVGLGQLESFLCYTLW